MEAPGELQIPDCGLRIGLWIVDCRLESAIRKVSGTAIRIPQSEIRITLAVPLEDLAELLRKR
jgi:hypothetical protein